jgi:hypothetical protein
MILEVLYFDGCPMWQPAFARLQEVLVEEGLPWRAEVIKIRDQADAYRHKFIGSPTVRVDGRDVGADAWPPTDYGFGCRIYQYEGKISGVPSKEMLRSALHGKLGGAATPAASTCGCCTYKTERNC